MQFVTIKILILSKKKINKLITFYLIILKIKKKQNLL